MLGYKKNFTPAQRLSHHQELLERYPKRKVELHHVYEWMSNADFVSALQNPSEQTFQWLKKSMEHPPLKILDHFIRSTQNELISLNGVKTTMVTATKPKCFLCEKPLADSISITVHFTVVECKCCRKKICHDQCADMLMMRTTKCLCCLTFHGLHRHFSMLRSMLP
jgi:hypothetical protein